MNDENKRVKKINRHLSRGCLSNISSRLCFEQDAPLLPAVGWGFREGVTATFLNDAHGSGGVWV